MLHVVCYGVYHVHTPYLTILWKLRTVPPSTQNPRIHLCVLSRNRRGFSLPTPQREHGHLSKPGCTWQPRLYQVHRGLADRSRCTGAKRWENTCYMGPRGEQHCSKASPLGSMSSWGHWHQPWHVLHDTLLQSPTSLPGS